MPMSSPRRTDSEMSWSENTGAEDEGDTSNEVASLDEAEDESDEDDDDDESAGGVV